MPNTERQVRVNTIVVQHTIPECTYTTPASTLTFQVPLCGSNNLLAAGITAVTATDSIPTDTFASLVKQAPKHYSYKAPFQRSRYCK